MIAHPYDDRLATGRLSAAGFVRVRLLRLYPLYIAGTALTIAAIAVAVVRQTRCLAMDCA